MTLEEIHQHLSVWPQRAIAVRAGACAVVLNAANEVVDALPEKAAEALRRYQHISQEDPATMVVLDRDALLSITSQFVGASQTAAAEVGGE